MRTACSVDNFWLPTGDGATGACWFWPEGAVASTGVLVVPGIIHEQQTMAVGLVALAKELASNGVPTLMIDLAGTAQGTGRLDSPRTGQRWDDEVRSAVHHMRDAGLQHIVVLGVRLGALIAAHATVDEPVDAMVMWAPVLSGRRYVRELQIMQASATETTGEALAGITVAGFNVPPDLVNHLKTLDAGKLGGKPAGRICIVDSAERLAELDPRHGLLAEVPTSTLAAPETENWLFTAADQFPGPYRDIVEVRRRIQTLAAEIDAEAVLGDVELAQGPPLRPDVSSLRSHEFDHDGVTIRETHVRFGSNHGGGPPRLAGIVSEPVGPTDASAAYVGITSVGPGRLFVDLARGEAARGRVTLRFELGGFGTSTRRGGAPGSDFYHPTAAADIGDAIDHLVASGCPAVTVVGFCAGAWSAFELPPRPDLAGIIAVNAQLLVRTRLLHRRQWPGQSRWADQLARIAQHREVRRIVMKLEREHPLPSPAIRRVGRHAEAGTAVTLVFAEGDLGQVYFDRRAHRPGGLRAPQRRPEVRVYPGLGHLPSGDARERMLADIHAAAD